jgi:hypothetical protein
MSASNLNLLDCISLLIIMLSMPLGWSLDIWIHGLLHLLRWLATSTNMGWSLGSVRLFRVKDRLIAMPGCSSTGKINYKELCTYAQCQCSFSWLDMNCSCMLDLTHTDVMDSCFMCQQYCFYGSLARVAIHSERILTVICWLCVQQLHVFCCRLLKELLRWRLQQHVL